MSETNKHDVKLTGDELEKLSLNELMEQLDQVVAWFNGGDVDLDQATDQFDYGVKLSELIKKRLTDAENKVTQIKLRLEKVETD